MTNMRLLLAALLATSVLILPVTAHAAAKIVIINQDAPGVGFNDTTPATPVGGNPGTTVGEQRLIAFQKAADIWASILDSDVEIKIQANFAPLECSANEGVLGSAGPMAVEADHPGAPKTNTWYHIALASRQAGEDRDPTGNDIRARFNGDLGKPNCLSGSSWYYGLDANPPQGGIDLVVVLIHEFAHGLGFSELIDDATGRFFMDIPDAYSHYILDNATGKTFIEMSNSERRTALTSGALVWNGTAVFAAAPSTLQLKASLAVSSPSSVAGTYPGGTAEFGRPVSQGPFPGKLVQAQDANNAEGPSTTDGCTTLTNPAEVAGNIAMIDRGTCTFVVKAKNAQNAGAIGVIIVDNTTSTVPPGMAGTDASITIPVISITAADGTKLKGALSQSVLGEIRGGPGMVGADDTGKVLLYAPNPIESGSSTSHWDRTATPNLLMEPSINQDLKHVVDLTEPHFRDIGWFAEAGMDATMTATPLGPIPPGAGDRIRYEVEISQVSGSAATSVRLTSALDPNVALSSGSVLVSKGEILSGNDAGDGSVEVLVGGLKPGEEATVRFDVLVKDTVPPGTTQVSTSAIVTGSNFAQLTKSATTPVSVNPMHATKTVRSRSMPTGATRSRRATRSATRSACRTREWQP
jgi:hypothetical protein